jgi:MAM domain, meprin/A5/mu/Secretion system C-terminal sorting domain/Fibronectin type III domain
MKKITLLLATFFLVLSFTGTAQVLNQSANWPNTAWTVVGTFTAAGLTNDPTITSNFTWDDDVAGGASTSDVIYVESPIIDLTAANTAGETFINISGNYLYRASGEILTLDYWNADGSVWVNIDNFAAAGPLNGAYKFCNGLLPYTSAALDIAGFTATQLSGFKYRIYYDDAATWNWGLCFDSPTIASTGCLAPSVLVAINITATTTDLGWIENGTATTWDIEWGIAGFTQGTGTMITGTTTNPTNLTGLTGNTSYDFYVRADCGGSGFSNWVGPFNFTTPCSAMIAPWLDDVEAHTPTTNLGLSNCWNTTAATGYDWNIDGAASTPSGGTGPTGAFSGTNYFYVEASGSAAGSVAELISPTVDLTALTSPILEYYCHMYGTAVMGNLFVDAWDGSNWITLDSLIGQQQAAAGDPWLKRTVNLSAFSGITQIRFRAISNGSFQGDISLDDISVKEAPSCLEPTFLTVSNIAATSADLGWTENGSATTWQIEWGTTGFVQGTGTTAIVTTNPFNLTSLTSNTIYDFYVRAVCGPADTSLWSSSSTFTTPCAVIPAPWLDDVEAHNPATNIGFSNCWNATANGLYTWNITGTGTTVSTGTGPLSAFSGTNFFYIESSTGSLNDVAELISPSVNINPLSNPVLKFYYHMFGVQIGSLYIDVWDGSTWTTLDSIIGEQQTVQTDPWLLKSINLSTFSGAIQVKFRSISTGGFLGDIAIDNIEIDGTVGITDNSENINLSVYPSPNNGMFTLNVNTEDTKQLEIKIVTLQGQVVFTKNNFDNISNVSEQINLSNNANGIYFIVITSDKGIITHKIVVQ